MNLQEAMFAEVENWLVKWKSSQRVGAHADFREVDFMEVKLGKVLEIEAPSGVKITVFA